MANVNLEDVLAGQHLSPFTLGEFEDHLVHVQHSAENLYFYFWLSDYTKQYREWQASLSERKKSLTPLPDNVAAPSRYSKGGIRESLKLKRKGVVRLVPPFVRNMVIFKAQGEAAPGPEVHEVQLSSIPPVLSKASVPEELKKSFESLQSFIIPPRQSNQALEDFELELNISQQLKDQFKLQAANSVDPDIFLPIKKEVMNMLTDSMRSWLMDCAGNSDRHRARLTLCIGVLCVILAVIGTVLLMTKTDNAEIRLCLSPLVWIGLEIFFCGLLRTCPLIFMFGSFRQIHVWELGRAKEAAAVTEKNLLSKRHDFEVNQGKMSSGSGHCFPTPSECQRALLPSRYWDSGVNFRSSNELIIYGPPDDRNLPHVSISLGSSRNDAPPLNPTKSTPSSFSTRKPKHRKRSRRTQSHSSSAPIFGPLTKVLSPVAIRSHRINILKSMVLATILTAVWVAICLLVHTGQIPHLSKLSSKFKKEQ